jgi:hypothetical protein
VQLVEPLGGTLLPVQTIYIKLIESEANIVTVSQGIQEILDSEETFVLTDCTGQEIHDSSGTQRNVADCFYTDANHFWFSPSGIGYVKKITNMFSEYYE